MIDNPLMPNPLAGGGANFNTSPPGTLLDNPFSNITAPGQIPDRYKKGFEEFYKQNPDDYMRMGGQAISYVTTPQGERIQFGDTGGATNFRRYLESIGETPRDDSLSLAQGSGPLATIGAQTPPGFGPQVIDQRLIDQTEFNKFPGNPNRKPLDLFAERPVLTGDEERVQAPPLLDGTKGFPVTVSGPEGIASTATAPETGLFNRVGQQLIGYDDQFSGINDRLNKIEEGIASLVQNRGQGLNMNTGGLGYFFNPFGGFYG